MNQDWATVVGWIVASGFVGFVLMGIDKARARNGKWRVSKRTFFVLALAGGAFGIIMGSLVFHHKTLKTSFMVTVLVLVLVWAAALLELGLLLGLPLA